MKISGFSFRFDRGLWIGVLKSSKGDLEAILNGDSNAPATGDADAFSEFCEDLEQNLLKAKSRILFGFLYIPIRLAVNSECRIGVQFRNRITGNQSNVVFL